MTPSQDQTTEEKIFQLFTDRIGRKPTDEEMLSLCQSMRLAGRFIYLIIQINDKQEES